LKKLALFVVLFAVAATVTAPLTGCDSSTSPKEVVDTLRIHDTTYYNDRFAKANAIVHGIWQLTTATDTATATLFQDTTSVMATIQWKSGATWNLTTTKFTKDSLILSGDNNFLNLWAKFTDSANHMITKMNGTYLNARNPPANGSIPTWTAKRTF
jgi:hypothetical protein